ncbi:TRAP transporter substrate-binding protein [Thalassospira alkalitolerans]|uniref:TRAP transporter substrate-binding protein n=1 Tax=Thalassospira alkalitolerans TaxID=1293890 RepID=UPI0030EDC15A|tara:strand:+ start:62473 stop:63450 length:978 start_codon:yes stop_codon:yes gene_type:complete
MLKIKTTKKLIIAGVAAMLMSNSAIAAEMTLKLGHLANEQNAWHKAAVKFGEELSSLTDGRIDVQVFPNETLGKEVDLINGMQLGSVDMTITGETLQNWAPMAALLAVPYAYATLEDMDAVADGEIGDKIEQQILEKARIRPIAYFARGPRNLTSSRAIKSPDDLNGLKLRVPNVPLFVDVWKSLGAQPTPMAFSEVFTSLQAGTIDAQENPLALIDSASFYEVQKFVNKTEHVRSWIYLTISDITWGKLSDADKDAVMEAAKRAQAYERGLFTADEDRLTKELQDKGMTFVEVDKQAFAQKAKAAVLANVSDEIRPIVENLFAK